MMGVGPIPKMSRGVGGGDDGRGGNFPISIQRTSTSKQRLPSSPSVIYGQFYQRGIREETKTLSQRTKQDIRFSGREGMGAEVSYGM